MMKRFGLFVVLAALLLTGCRSTLPPEEMAADFSLHRIFGSGMVLQRDRAIRVAGQADPGKHVTITLDRDSVSVRADEAGRFLAELPARPAGGPYTLTVQGREKTEVLNDILVGDVWLGSGQSNMEMTVRSCLNLEAEKAAGNHPRIRHYRVPHTAAVGAPRVNLDKGGKWVAAAPDTIAGFSAVLYFFARDLQKEVNVPIGIINSSWGGTPIAPWISAAAFEQSGDRLMVENSKTILDTAAIEKLNKQFQLRFAEWEKQLFKDYAAETAAAANWKDTNLDTTSGWRKSNVPTTLSEIDVDGNGVVWFRKQITIPRSWAGKDLVLSLGVIDDCDDTYVNGQLVGRTTSATPNYWAAKRRYVIPAALVEPGFPNLIAVRLIDQAFGGGMLGGVKELALHPVGDEKSAIPLAGEWLTRVEFIINWNLTKPRPTPVDTGGAPARRPAALYNGMIAPLQFFPIRGILWYQGEANAGDAPGYARNFPLLIESWRAGWNQPEMPFIFAQLAAFHRHTPKQPMPAGFFASRPPSDDNGYPKLRESQTATLKLPATGMAVCIDIGDPVDIHPANKQAVGHRMMLEALRLSYGRLDVFSAAPLYDSMSIEGSTIRIRFRPAGLALTARGGKLKSFAIAGADNVFHWADATIDGDTVLVRSPKVKAPKNVRYAWDGYPEGANLFVRGLPVSPFRTNPPDYIK